PGWRLSGASGRPTLMRWSVISIEWRRHPRRRKEKPMNNRETYVPGPAAGAEVKKSGETWTLVLVRELRHPPAMVWQALTDPAQLAEWAPFDADRSLASVGPVKLTTIGAPPAHAVTETQVKRAEASKTLEYTWGGGDI